MYTSARSPPPLAHPRPQQPPSHIPSTSPPPPSEYDDSSYQTFSSPPASTHQYHPSQYLHSQPDTFVPSGLQGNVMGNMYTPMYNNGNNQHNNWMGQMGMGQQQIGGQGMGNPAMRQHQGMGNTGMGSTGMGQMPWGMNDATAQIGVQFGRQAFDAGQAYIDKNFIRMLPVSQLKHSFNVSNKYVLMKLQLVLFPWRHRPWSRSVIRSETTGAVEGYQPPREDVNAPDLYIPAMALITYMLLAAVVAASKGAFDPSILGQKASMALGLLLVEFFCIKLGIYLLGIVGESTVVDLVAYEGYKYVGIIVTLLVRLFGFTGWKFWIVFFYVFFANFFFLLRSLRHIVLPDPALSPLDTHGTSSMNSGAMTGGVSHTQRSSRIQFLFFIALSQGLYMALLVRV